VLRKHGRARCFTKSRAEPRPTGRSFAGLLAGINAGDVVMVTRLDRLARSTRDLFNTLAAITGKKAGFKSIGNTWADTTTAHGRLMLTVPAGLGRVRTRPDRRAHRRRPSAGRGARAENGPAAQIDAASEARGDQAPRHKGESLAEIGRSYNVSAATISRLTA
jgi:DNA invertase Pin-like site-specific DNA recombinase